MKAIMSALLLLFAVMVSAQEIHFCLSYTVLGEPLRVSSSWNVGSDGGYLYILYKQPDALQNSKYEVVVSEESNNQFAEVSRRHIISEIGKNWAAVYHKFSRGGDFKVTVQKDGQVIASEYLTILQKTETSAKKRFKNDPRLHYANTKVVACQTVREGKPVNPSAVFGIAETSLVTFLIMNDKSFNANKLNIDLYRKDAPFGDYSEFVESRRIELEREGDNTYFTLQFIQPGEYKVYIYDEDQVWINSGYVTINSK